MTEKNDVNNITIESTKEEVAKFFINYIKSSKEIAENIIKEDISGEILPELSDNDFKSLGIKTGDKKKFLSYKKKNEDKFIKKPINISIKVNSTSEEIKHFLVNYLLFNGNLNNMNGEKIFELSNKDMENIGLNLGQRIKLSKYIEYVKEQENIKITKNISKDEVALYLKKELSFSEKSIKELDLDGESLFLIEEEEIDDSEDFKILTEEEKKNLKNFLKKKK